MIKTKCNLDINIIKPLTKLGRCGSNCYYFNFSRSFCRLYGAYINDTVINICKNFSKSALDIIERRISISEKFCANLCTYIFFDLDHKLYRCKLFNKFVGSKGIRCKQCIDLHKGCYL